MARKMLITSAKRKNRRVGSCKTQAINRHIEKQGSRNASFRNIGVYFKTPRKYFRNTDLGLSVASVAAILLYVTTRKFGSTELMMRKGMWDKVELTAMIEMNVISLALKADENGNRMKMC
jgi:hypothetical protein